MRNFVVGFDNSEVSLRALEIAKKYAGEFQAKICIITSTPYGDELRIGEYEKFAKRLEEIKDELTQSGFECETHLISPSVDPGTDLLKFAKRNSSEAIIIGIRQRSALSKMVLGSTAKYVLFYAECPVITVR